MIAFKMHRVYANSDLPSNLPSNLPSKLEATFKAICEGCNASSRELARKTGQSERTARNHISELKSLGYIRRVGSDRSGCWEVLGRMAK